jgi:hypothetical protein
MISLAALAVAGPLSAQPRGLTVVELFTSQGCSSCPPANANVMALSSRPDVLALSFNVTYWDQLGWKDTFAQPAYTQRQVDYERGLNREGPFTPQVVVDGRRDVVGNVRSEIEELIASSKLEGPSLTVSGGEVQIGAGRAPGAPADVWLVRYDPRVVQIPVQRGENGGRTLPHKNVVHSLTRLGDWRGPATTYAIPPAPAGLSTAVLVQGRSRGSESSIFRPPRRESPRVSDPP